MEADRRQKIERLFHDAVDIGPERSTSYLQQACHGDEVLKAEVERLLANETDARGMYGITADGCSGKGTEQRAACK